METFSLDKPTWVERIILALFVFGVVGIVFGFGFWMGSVWKCL